MSLCKLTQVKRISSALKVVFVKGRRFTLKIKFTKIALRNAIAEIFIPTSSLESEREELEQDLIFAKNDGYENTEEAIEGITEELERVNAALERRQRRAS